MLIFCSHLESEPVGQYQPVQYMRIIPGDFSTGSASICILRNGLVDNVLQICEVDFEGTEGLEIHRHVR